MKIFVWVVRFLIPFAVLYSIGYLVPGFSALTILWISGLAALITIGEWLVIKLIGRRMNQWGQLIIYFLVATFIIFTVTLAIEDGNVPLNAALLAAAIIAVLNLFLVRPLQVL